MRDDVAVGSSSQQHSTIELVASLRKARMMSDSALSKKLLIKPRHRVAVLNAPTGLVERLSEVPEGVDLSWEPDGVRDVVLVFTTDTAELERLASTAVASVKREGALWVAYPKKTSKIKTDLSRDVSWQPLRGAGFEVVSSIAIDDTWSALRFRPVELVGR
jgi:hypothetical protein